MAEEVKTKHDQRLKFFKYSEDQDPSSAVKAC